MLCYNVFLQRLIIPHLITHINNPSLKTYKLIIGSKYLLFFVLGICKFVYLKKNIKQNKAYISMKFKICIYLIIFILLFTFNYKVNSQDLLCVKEDINITSTCALTVKGSIKGTSASIDNDGILDLTGDWTNNASSTFLKSTNNSGEVIFNSSASQTITGTQTTTFYDLTINNSGTGIILGHNINVEHYLTMTDGDIDLQNDTIALSTTGSLTGETAANRIKVSDPANHTGTITATRDVSNVTNYNIAGLGMELTTTENLGSTTIIRGHQQQQGSGSFSGNYSIFRYYDILPTNSEETTIRFNYFEDELNGHSESELIMYHDIGYWQPISTTTDATNDRVTAATNSFSKFTIGSESFPLPIELLDFTAKWYNTEQTQSLLNWVTASETNNQYFEIQKSKDANNWEQLEIINGAGTSNSVNNYELIDNEPYNKITYYKLKQTDYNGNYEYSDIISLSKNNHTIDIISIYPNPAAHNISFEIITTQDTEVNIFITDNTGKIIFTDRKQLKTGNNLYTINISRFAAAAYIIKVITKSGLDKVTKVFMKK